MYAFIASATHSLRRDSKREQASQMLHLGFPFHFSLKMGSMGILDPREEVRALVHLVSVGELESRGRGAETEVEEMRRSLGLFLCTIPDLLIKNQTHSKGIVRAQLIALSHCV